MLLRKPLLGAVELVELGRVSRRKTFMGDVAGNLEEFFGGVLSEGSGTLASAANVPPKALVEGNMAAFRTLSGLLRDIPILGDIVASLLLVTNAAIQKGLAIQGFTIMELKNLSAGLTQIFETVFPEKDQASRLLQAKEDLISRAPEAVKPTVASMLSVMPTLRVESVGDDTISLVLVGAAAVAVAAFLL